VHIGGALTTILLLATIATSVLTGRGLARRLHDAMLVRRVEGWLRIVFLGAMPPLVFLAILNIATVLAVRLVSASFTALLAVTGEEGWGSVVASTVTLVASTAFFAAKYRGVDEPLTREGRLLLYPTKRLAKLR
jgi:hypothetical protein